MSNESKPKPKWQRLRALLRALNPLRGDRRYRRAVRVLAALGEPRLAVLLERVEARLPLPPEALADKSSDVFNGDPREFLVLAANYVALMRSPAAQDLFGRLFKMHQTLARRILEGEVDSFGNDLTPKLRVQLGTVEQIIAIPAIIEGRKAFIEEQEGLADPTQGLIQT